MRETLRQLVSWIEHTVDPFEWLEELQLSVDDDEVSADLDFGRDDDESAAPPPDESPPLLH